MLVFALDLQDIKEVCGRRVNLDHILVGTGLRVRQLRDLELLRPLRSAKPTLAFTVLLLRGGLTLRLTLTYLATWMPRMVTVY
jgi:hypothetical protein